MESFWLAWKIIHTHFFVQIQLTHTFLLQKWFEHTFLSQKQFTHTLLWRKRFTEFFLSQKRFTHFVRKVFARWKLPSGKFRLFGPLGVGVGVSGCKFYECLWSCWSCWNNSGYWNRLLASVKRQVMDQKYVRVAIRAPGWGNKKIFLTFLSYL